MDLRCGYCEAKVKYHTHVCPECQHLLANDVKVRRVVGRIITLILSCLLLVGVGIVIGLTCF